MFPVLPGKYQPLASKTGLMGLIARRLTETAHAGNTWYVATLSPKTGAHPANTSNGWSWAATGTAKRSAHTRIATAWCPVLTDVVVTILLMTLRSRTPNKQSTVPSRPTRTVAPQSSAPVCEPQRSNNLTHRRLPQLLQTN